MKIRLILTDRAWEYRMNILPQQPGCYYVGLRGLDGAALEPAVFTGTFPSLDQIVANAHEIYLRLVAMREANAAATAQQTTPHETTLHHSAEFSRG